MGLEELKATLWELEKEREEGEAKGREANEHEEQQAKGRADNERADKEREANGVADRAGNNVVGARPQVERAMAIDAPEGKYVPVSSVGTVKGIDKGSVYRDFGGTKLCIVASDWECLDVLKADEELEANQANDHEEQQAQEREAKGREEQVKDIERYGQEPRARNVVGVRLQMVRLPEGGRPFEDRPVRAVGTIIDIDKDCATVISASGSLANGYSRVTTSGAFWSLCSLLRSQWVEATRSQSVNAIRSQRVTSTRRQWVKATRQSAKATRCRRVKATGTQWVKATRRQRGQATRRHGFFRLAPVSKFPSLPPPCQGNHTLICGMQGKGLHIDKDGGAEMCFLGEQRVPQTPPGVGRLLGLPELASRRGRSVQ